MDSYDMSHPSRGKALIINNVDFHSRTGMGSRPGSDRDASALYAIFDELSFDVVLKKNLNYKDTVTTLEQSKLFVISTIG